jgi:hypothetical protein
VLTSYLVIAVALFTNLWRHLPQGRLAVGGIDQYLFEWYLWHGPHAVFGGSNPLFTTLWNPPDGANLMANTSVLGLGLPLAPLTMLLGPQVTLAVVITLGMAGSAAAWYWLLRRVVPGATLGPALGGGFCGFAPAMVSHANGGHLNLVITALVPFIAANALGLRERGRVLRAGATLGLLVTYQMFIGEELVLLSAMGLGLFCAVYAVLRPRLARAELPRLAARLGVALAVALPLLAFPLWWQFTGPQHYSGIESARTTVNDLMAMITLPSQSFIGDLASTQPYVAYHSEENAFFGLPLMFLLAFGAWRLRRELLVRISVIVILFSCVLSLGGTIHVAGHSLLPGPWGLLEGLPVFDSVIVSRLTLLAVPFIGVLLALLTTRAMAAAADRPRAEALRVRRYALLGIAAALVSVAPAPLPVIDRPATPDFITSGVWEQVIIPGSTVMTVPMTMSNGGIDTINWQVPTNGQFSLVGGYFVGPHDDDQTGHYFPDNTSTQRLINSLWLTGKGPTITADLRAKARTDLTTLEVDVIVVAERGHWQEVNTALTQLLSLAPVRVDDVWTWRIQDGAAIRTVY